MNLIVTIFITITTAIPLITAWILSSIKKENLTNALITVAIIILYLIFIALVILIFNYFSLFETIDKII